MRSGVCTKVVHPRRILWGAPSGAHDQDAAVNSEVFQGSLTSLTRLGTRRCQQDDLRVCERTADPSAIGPKLVNDRRIEGLQNLRICLRFSVGRDSRNLRFVLADTLNRIIDTHSSGNEATTGFIPVAGASWEHEKPPPVPGVRDPRVRTCHDGR